MIQESQARLKFGSLGLAGAEDDHATPYSLYAAGEDGTLGNPETVVAIVDSLLGDGQLASVVRHNNREARFGITVTADDGAALAAAEAALVAETEKQNVLTWSPPDGFAPVTVFDVVTSWLEHVFDDVDELQTTRRYVLHLTLYPHARSSTATTVPAEGSGITPVAPPSETTVSTCDSLTGWTARAALPGQVDALAVTGGTQLVQRADIGFDLWMQYDTGAVQDWTASPFLVIDWGFSGSSDDRFTATVTVSGPALSATALTLLSVQTLPTAAGDRRSVFSIPAAIANKIRFVRIDKRNDLTSPADGRWGLWLNNVKVTDGGAANDGTARQLSRSLSIGGSARAMGVIDVRHDSILGDVLVWSGPAACSPPLRRIRVSGTGPVADTTMVSGAYEDLATAFTADAPLSTIPSGAYLVMARLKASSAGGAHLIDVTAQTRLATAEATYAAVGATLTLNDVSVDLSTGFYKILPLGVMHLPSAEVAPGSSGVLRITLQGADTLMDEAWLFNITDGDLTQVATADKVLRITAPSLVDPRWRVWTGPSDTALYDAGSKMQLRGQHLLNPGTWSAFTVTTGAEDAAVSLTYDKRWHTHAGEDG